MFQFQIRNKQSANLNCLKAAFGSSSYINRKSIFNIQIAHVPKMCE